MRDHQAVIIEEFKGLWVRGASDSVPANHFIDATNISYNESGFESRSGIEPYIKPRIDGARTVLRMYAFNVGLEGIITLDDIGDFHHIVNKVPHLILSVATADDFSMVVSNGRAYINPFSQSGLNDYLYVYNGSFGPARRVGCAPPVNADGTMTAANNAAAGSVEAGIHIFGVVYETDSGFLTQIGPDTLPFVTAPGGQRVDLASISRSPNSFVIARHIVATKAINPADFTGNTRGYEMFFVPGGTINDNTSTTLTVSFYDSQLLQSAAGLFDLESSVANGGGGLAIYHNRLVVCGTGPAQARVSNPGEFEAFDKITGFLTLQNDGLGITTAQEYRDTLYVFKINETVAFTDNGDVPVSWPNVVIDEGLGAGIHGVVYIGTRTGTSSEYLLIHNLSGIFMFNGTFIRPELSYKIKDLWLSFDVIEVTRLVEFYNDTLHQIILLNIPSLKIILIGNYANGLTPETIRWARWSFLIRTNSIMLFERTNKLLIGSQNVGSAAGDGIYVNNIAKLNDEIFNGDVLTTINAVTKSVTFYLVGD